MSNLLQVDIFVTPPVPFGPANAQGVRNTFSPCSSTLIQGPTSIVVADPPFTTKETEIFADWIEKTAPGKKLTHIFLTHTHGDHWFGAPILLERFPGSQLVGTKKVVDSITASGPEAELSPQRTAFWNALFPNGEVPRPQTVPTALPASNEFFIDGHVCKAVDVPGSDCSESSFLHVPDLKLVVAGDIVYGDCHQYLVTSNTAEKRQLWLDSLDMVAALNPAIVVPGHKRATQVDGPYLIEATKGYIQAFGDEFAKAKNSTDLEATMLKLYPNRFNALVVKRFCDSAFAA